MDRFTKKQRSILMAKVKTSNTDIENILNDIVRPFWRIERYRKNVKTLPGKPDIVFPKSRIAIFADGDFWHGRNFGDWRKKIPAFWKRKISLNVRRDRSQSVRLKRLGYRVIRSWGSDLLTKNKKKRRIIINKLSHYLCPNLKN